MWGIYNNQRTLWYDRYYDKHKRGPDFKVGT